jgi:hypothetical protein
MKTLILFREGLSGHYLKSLVDDDPGVINFRVDPWYPGIYDATPFTIKNCVCVHTHLVDHQTLSKNFDLTLTIQVRKKLYHAIYNNFYKKYLVENPKLQDDFIHWTDNTVFWYDTTYYNIKEYFDLHQQDLATNTYKNIIEFDNLLEIDYLEQIFKHYYNKDLTENMKRIIKTYANLQLQYDLSRNETEMHDIVSILPDRVFSESPWYASYCIFKFEKNNNLHEHQRQWSVNDITKPIDKQFLIEISKKY